MQGRDDEDLLSFIGEDAASVRARMRRLKLGGSRHSKDEGLDHGADTEDLSQRARDTEPIVADAMDDILGEEAHPDVSTRHTPQPKKAASGKDGHAVVSREPAIDPARSLSSDIDHDGLAAVRTERAGDFTLVTVGPHRDPITLLRTLALVLEELELRPLRFLDFSPAKEGTEFRLSGFLQAPLGRRRGEGQAPRKSHNAQLTRLPK